ncbi:MAG: FRG domain-containing protein [Treponema sp.]|nr:FRG domain-containing protein [Treponema sp.]
MEQDINQNVIHNYVAEVLIELNKKINDYQKSDYQEKNNQKKENDNFNVHDGINNYFIFRGINKYTDTEGNEIVNEEPKIQSGAALRLKNTKHQKQLEFLEYHKNLINYAKQNYLRDLSDISEKTDLDILAFIEHNRGATCLIDFSLNFLIALYFACASTDEKSKKMAGYVFFLNVNSPSHEDLLFKINSRNKKMSINELLTKKARAKSVKKSQRNRIWFWQPEYTNSRIKKQDSVFLFGLDAIDNNLKYSSIKIDSGKKEHILNELNNFFNISQLDIYDDLPGFAGEANNKYQTIANEILDTGMCIQQIKNLIKNEEYDEAERLCIKALGCVTIQNKDCGRCENNLIKRVEILNQYSIVKYNKAMESDNDFDKQSLILQETNFLEEEYEIVCKNTNEILAKNDVLVLSIFRRLLFCYYDTEQYEKGLDIINEYFNRCEICNLEKEDQRDWILMGLELSVLARDKKNFIYYDEWCMKKVSCIDDPMCEIIYDLFFEIDYTFRNKKEYSPKIVLPTDEKILEYYLVSQNYKKIEYWGFGDTKKWLKKNERKIGKILYIYLLEKIFKIERLQSCLKDKIINVLPAY